MRLLDLLADGVDTVWNVGGSFRTGMYHFRIQYGQFATCPWLNFGNDLYMTDSHIMYAASQAVRLPVVYSEKHASDGE